MNLSTVEKQTMSKIMGRLLSFSVLMYFVNIIDRSNIGFTALDMNKALNIESATFGILTAAFFVGYFFFEVPSNVLLHKFGARKWMARILISWGLVTSAMFYAQNSTHIILLRFLLGVCEAGFFPGMIYYFTYWFPERYRARIIGIFFIAAPIASVVGAPLATQIMTHINWFGADGWRWVYMVEGLMAVICGFFCFSYLLDKPQDAKWLSQEEKNWINQELASENSKNREITHLSIGKVFLYKKVWYLALLYMFIQITTQSMQFWMPTLVKEFSSTYSNAMVGYLMMLPPALGFISILYWGRHSDKTGERVYHTAIPMVIMIISLMMMAMSESVPLKIIALALSGIGNYAFYAPFWAIPTIYLTGEAAAVGVAIINSMSSFGGFSGNLIVGAIKTTPLGTGGVLFFQSLCAAISLVMTLRLKVRKVENLT